MFAGQTCVARGIGTEKPQATLDVNGLIRTSKGIVFPDGTTMTTAADLPDAGSSADTSPRNPGTRVPFPVLGEVAGRLKPAAGATSRLTLQPNVVTPDYQFKVDATGVHVGTTPAFGLDVAGDVTLASNLALPATTSSAPIALRE